MENKGVCIWFTGLSGAGKTTLASHLAKELDKHNLKTCILDGDILRDGLCSDLSMTSEDRIENNRRAREVAKLMVDSGLVVLSAFISPHKVDRDRAKRLIGTSRFIEVYVSTPIETCRQRDPKGLYKLSEKGEINNVVGIDLPYDKPVSPSLTIDTSSSALKESIQILVEHYLCKVGAQSSFNPLKI